MSLINERQNAEAPLILNARQLTDQQLAANMAPKQQQQQEGDDDAGNMLKVLMDQAEDLDMLAETAGVSGDSSSAGSSAATDPKSLIVPGYEISKLFAVVSLWSPSLCSFTFSQGRPTAHTRSSQIEFAFQHANDASEGSLLEGLGMMTREQAVKAVNGTFCFIVHSPSQAKSATGEVPKEVAYWVEMRRNGAISRVDKPPAKPKPDVVLRVADKDMVALATNKMNPQMAFMKGRISESDVRRGRCTSLRLGPSILTGSPVIVLPLPSRRSQRSKAT